MVGQFRLHDHNPPLLASPSTLRGVVSGLFAAWKVNILDERFVLYFRCRWSVQRWLARGNSLLFLSWTTAIAVGSERGKEQFCCLLA